MPPLLPCRPITMTPPSPPPVAPPPTSPNRPSVRSQHPQNPKRLGLLVSNLFAAEQMRRAHERYSSTRWALLTDEGQEETWVSNGFRWGFCSHEHGVAPLYHMFTAATPHSPHKHATATSTRSSASKPPLKSLTTHQNPRFFPLPDSSRVSTSIW